MVERNENLECADAEGVYQERRVEMVEQQLRGRGIKDERVLRAMSVVPRHRFVPEPLRVNAYEDRPLPIDEAQTISQPYVVALMSELLELSPGQKVLEIGTGSGYQTAVLAEMGAEIHSIEVRPALAQHVSNVLRDAGYGGTVRLRCGDGYQGWPEAAPFDRIIVTAGPPAIPDALVEQLAEGGRLVVPVGDGVQELTVLAKIGDRFQTLRIAPVRFVPMVRSESLAATE